MSHTNNGCLHVAKLTSTPMTTVNVQPTAVYHRNDSLNSGSSTNLHTQTTRRHVVTESGKPCIQYSSAKRMQTPNSMITTTKARAYENLRIHLLD